MKTFLFIFLAGYAVKCDDNYYVVQMPDTLRTKELKVYWNVPTMQCRSKRIPFEDLFQKFGIIQNTNDSFRGDKIAILYDPGNFPALIQNKSGDDIKYRNGGVPQEGDLLEHLKAFKLEIEKSIPDKNFDGVGIIDFESWRPILSQNFGELKPYKTISYSIERKRHWWWKKEWIEEEATRRFEASARDFMQTTLSLAIKLRPKALWGYYGYPYCFNRGYNADPRKCAKDVDDQNDRIDWLWSKSTALFPSVYSTKELTSSQLTGFIRGRVQEAARVMYKGTPILPYWWFRYRNGGYFSQEDLNASFDTFYNSSANGFIIWGGSSDVNTKEKCLQLRAYVMDVLGPTIAKYTKQINRQNDIPETENDTEERPIPNHVQEEIQSIEYIFDEEIKRESNKSIIVDVILNNIANNCTEDCHNITGVVLSTEAPVLPVLTTKDPFKDVKYTTARTTKEDQVIVQNILYTSTSSVLKDIEPYNNSTLSPILSTEATVHSHISDNSTKLAINDSEPYSNDTVGITLSTEAYIVSLNYSTNITSEINDFEPYNYTTLSPILSTEENIFNENINTLSSTVSSIEPSNNVTLRSILNTENNSHNTNNTSQKNTDDFEPYNYTTISPILSTESYVISANNNIVYTSSNSESEPSNNETLGLILSTEALLILNSSSTTPIEIELYDNETLDSTSVTETYLIASNISDPLVYNKSEETSTSLLNNIELPIVYTLGSILNTVNSFSENNTLNSTISEPSDIGPSDNGILGSISSTETTIDILGVNDALDTSRPSVVDNKEPSDNVTLDSISDTELSEHNTLNTSTISVSNDFEPLENETLGLILSTEANVLSENNTIDTSTISTISDNESSSYVTLDLISNTELSGVDVLTSDISINESLENFNISTTNNVEELSSSNYSYIDTILSLDNIIETTSKQEETSTSDNTTQFSSTDTFTSDNESTRLSFSLSGTNINGEQSITTDSSHREATNTWSTISPLETASDTAEPSTEQVIVSVV